MDIKVKICGINSPQAAEAAAQADYAGFVFYPPSPRHVSAQEAAALMEAMPDTVKKVGLFVNADDQEIRSVLEKAPLDMLQFHGEEYPPRVMMARATFGLPVIKAIKIASAIDLETAHGYLDEASMILFDAKPPADMENALPGGNALSFDWTLLKDFDLEIPWMLSGGLNAQNLAEAVEKSGAKQVDVSSGVESEKGKKDAAKIRDFLNLAASL